MKGLIFLLILVMFSSLVSATVWYELDVATAGLTIGNLSGGSMIGNIAMGNANVTGITEITFTNGCSIAVDGDNLSITC